METKSSSKPKIQIPIPIPIPRNMKRSSSSNSESLTPHLDDSPHSPLRFHSPLRSDQGDPPESPTYSSPIASPDKPPPIASPEKPPPFPPVAEGPMAIVAVDKFTQFSPALSPVPPQNLAPAGTVPEVVLNRAVREQGPGATGVRKVGPEGRTAGVMRRSSSMEERLKVLELGFRLAEVVLCLISFSVMAADKTEGWSGDSFDRYKEYRYCLAVNVIAFVYAVFQAYDLSYHLASGKHVIRHHLRRQFNFFVDQVLAYLLVSASSSAATRVDDWQSNWGKDQFTEMASASVAMAFLAFVAFAASSLASGYHLCNRL